MKKVLISIFLGILMTGVAAAQDNTAPTQASPPSEPQTTSPAEPKTQEPAPETQTPTTQPAPQPSTQTPQAQTASPAQPGAVKRVAAGSVIPVLLSKTVDAKKAKTGDEVVAKITQDLKANSGEVVFAKDTKVMGHVTEAQARDKEQKQSQLGIAFDHAVMKDGSEMQLPMSIQAIIAPQNDQSNAGGGNSDGGYSGSAAGANPNSGNAGRAGGNAGSAPPTTSSPSSGNPTDAQAGANARPPITTQTQGVIGISHLNLEPAAQGNTQGSVVTSEKNNVKLESGTMILLRVN